MENITDDLLAGINDEMTKEIELFLLNNVESKDAQNKIIEFINRAYTDGSSGALNFIDQAKKDFQDQATEFQKEFEQKLLNGQNKPASE